MSYSALVQQEAGRAGLSYTSRRSPVYATRGMAASSQPLASAAGLRILQAGGNAADAAVAMAASLNVLEPTSTGIGGDAFALFYEAASKRVHCMMGNGAAPQALTLDWVRQQGVAGTELPPFHAMTVSVPGAAALWEDAVQQWGTLGLQQVLEPAIEMAEQGVPVAPITAFFWDRSIQQLAGAAGAGASSPLLKADGSAPQPGELFRNPGLAQTFRRLASLGAKEGFYKGPVAEAMVAALQQRGGCLGLADLAAHATEVVPAISTTYRGVTIWEPPPPTQGMAALIGLNLLEADAQLPASSPPGGGGGGKPCGSAPWLHSAVEAMRLAFADVLEHGADPRAGPVPVEALLSKARAAARRAALVRDDQACEPVPDATLRGGAAPHAAKGGDTVYFCVVDGQGNACSFINSNYMGFGTGIVPEGCGFTLQNRCHNFTLQQGHPNCLAPGKRPYHTIMPGMATDAEGDLCMAFGVMGGFMQPQGHLQVVSRLLDGGQDPQAALDAPRFCLDGIDSSLGAASLAKATVLLEEGIPEAAAQQLHAWGHKVVWPVSGERRAIFGRGQIIVRDKETGVLAGGSDGRADGACMGW